MGEPFVYKEGVDVPRDVRHLAVDGSVRVLRRRTFEDYENLVRVELREGVEEIGEEAFQDCINLERVDCPSSLRTIGDDAFFWCCRLLAVNLPEGLRRIGVRAFHSCHLKRIAVPSSVVEIGRGAFSRCIDLEEVTSTGEMVMVESQAFCDCPRLDRIGIPATAIVVEVRKGSSGRAAVVTGGIKPCPHGTDRLILKSHRYLMSIGPADLAGVTDAIDQIINGQMGGAHPLDLMDGDLADRIRDCIDERVSAHKTDVATMLELALWKSNIERGRTASRCRPAGGGKGARVNFPTREEFRITCSADTVVGLVLPFLGGPHRRVGQEENAGAVEV